MVGKLHVDLSNTLLVGPGSGDFEADHLGQESTELLVPSYLIQKVIR